MSRRAQFARRRSELLARLTDPSRFDLRPTGPGPVLDVGCGVKKWPGATGLDISADTEADIVHDLNAFPYPLRGQLVRAGADAGRARARARADPGHGRVAPHLPAGRAHPAAHAALLLDARLQRSDTHPLLLGGGNPHTGRAPLQPLHARPDARRARDDRPVAAVPRDRDGPRRTPLPDPVRVLSRLPLPRDEHPRRVRGARVELPASRRQRGLSAAADGGPQTYTKELCRASSICGPICGSACSCPPRGCGVLREEPWAARCELVTHPLLGRRGLKARRR